MRDSAGGPVVGAVVVLKNLETNSDRTHVSNAAGTYVAALLRVGTYDVTVRAIGYSTLTPNGAIVQGPDGDEISIGGQRGIHNNVSVDGADFNNPFFGKRQMIEAVVEVFNLTNADTSRIPRRADCSSTSTGRSGAG